MWRGILNKLSEVMDCYHFHGNDIWNMHETGVTTVQKPSKPVATNGIKQVDAITTTERGTLITEVVTLTGNENSTYISTSMLVFSRLNFHDRFI